jgi:hypothetical protein
MNTFISKRKQSSDKRREARENNETTYMSATGCKHCELYLRYVSTRSCVSCTKSKNHQRKMLIKKSEPCLLEHHLFEVLAKDPVMLEYCNAF